MNMWNMQKTYEKYPMGTYLLACKFPTQSELKKYFLDSLKRKENGNIKIY